jgi:hypothetical protein
VVPGETLEIVANNGEIAWVVRNIDHVRACFCLTKFDRMRMIAGE